MVSARTSITQTPVALSRRSAAPDLLTSLSPSDRALLESHLVRRLETRGALADLRVVYDVLSACNLQCRGCSVSPSYRPTSQPLSSVDPPTASILDVLEELGQFAAETERSCSIIFGGGEPFLRPDMAGIIHRAGQIFGNHQVGVDTNGSVVGQANVLRDMNAIGYVGVSIDGPEEYHNWWRRGQVDGGSFRSAFDLVRELSADPRFTESLEVTSVATTGNMDLLPALLRDLAAIGVPSYSVHRAFPVGRMARWRELVPSAADYLRLMIELLRVSADTGIRVHMHHSIESIYTSILLGVDAETARSFGNPDRSSSIGITPRGEIVFDPWAIQRQSSGRPLSRQVLDDAFDTQSVTNMRDHRCGGCPMPCTGGSRTAAAEDPGQNVGATRSKRMQINVDPACPL